GKNKIMVLVVRMILYICPVVRVVTLLYLCPHFQFGRSVVSTHDMDDYAQLGEDVVDTTSDKLFTMMDTEEADEI
ncbi:unnamed protein product, partial [Candidula unifasciata]